METEKPDITTSEAEKEETYMDIVRSWGLLHWTGVIFGVVMIGWAVSDYIKKPTSSYSANSENNIQDSDALRMTVGMTRDEVVAKFGKPARANDAQLSYYYKNPYTGETHVTCDLWFHGKSQVQYVKC